MVLVRIELNRNWLYSIGVTPLIFCPPRSFLQQNNRTFSFHSQRDGGNASTERAGFIVNELMRLLAEGNSRMARTVGWYAAQLNVSDKYLSSTVKRLTGHSVISYIDRHTIPILKEYLDNPRYSLTQIANRMNFASLSYFSRYCKKHLGMTPTEYRSSLQPYV